MARRSASKSVKVNFKDVETRSTPAEGDYPLRVAEAKQEKSSNNNPQISFIFEISRGEAKGGKLYLHCPLIDNSLWKLASVLTALGVDVPADELDIDLDDLIDREMMGVVHHETYNGKKQARLGDWAPIDQYEGAADEKSSKKDKKGKKDKKSKDEPAEEETSTKKGKKAKDEPAAEETGKKVKKDKKGKVEPIYESDDVTALNVKKLQKLIDKHSLDVDLDDFKTDRKKAGAVVDALEAAGLLKD